MINYTNEKLQGLFNKLIVEVTSRVSVRARGEGTDTG